MSVRSRPKGVRRLQPRNRPSPYDALREGSLFVRLRKDPKVWVEVQQMAKLYGPDVYKAVARHGPSILTMIQECEESTPGFGVHAVRAMCRAARERTPLVSDLTTAAQFTGSLRRHVKKLRKKRK